MGKIIVRYVGGAIGNTNSGQVFGGTMATNYAIKKAFEKSDTFDLQMKMRDDFETSEQIKEWLDGGDISWLDDTSILERHFIAGYPRPDLIGPISRSPVKSYHKGAWKARYIPSYFYNGRVIRLNESEEKNSTLLPEYKDKENYISKIDMIRHGIDLELLKPNPMGRKYILWAGQKDRPAKNYPMWEQIQKEINDNGGLPEPYEFKTMSGYVVDDYWKALDETAILVNTSKYESFCNAVAEARAKGVPALVREKFNGDYMHLEQPGQTEYSIYGYTHAILTLCNVDEALTKFREDSLNYVKHNCSLDAMREDIEDVLFDIIDNR